jgi:UDP-N-acetylmuramoyl-L-alanyl-D-glutamate--LD-lysine ligase
MGELAANLADRIFLTDEESYSENPDDIRAMIRQGIERTKKVHKMTEIVDRKQAIYQALKSAVRGDTVLITGMGHEQYRIVNGKRIPWNDKTVVKEVLGLEKNK